ncbi:Isovaleryl-CoA dehydrogenase [Caballeronia glathei]|uniref:Acyl-CoA dehydrogenase n=1 Tax=Caballeronia glathei TaxID=60547 RepID=A0A069PKX2_9BURK|nr:acyl-CoA dehydrogenase family protein [Caballeronia glathei]KDR41260.1 acyl-CoA dehydrogenase [Caballeronia glathei]CDY78525.1 Isovaleryl-CoA dehydrogenase [Caballeronia glathei]
MNTTASYTDSEVLVSTERNDHAQLRDAVARICADFPAAYWRRLDAESGYPTEFVAALTAAGFLGALIPEEYGGSGMPLRAAAVILEEINANGCVASPAHAQMYIMGTLLRHGNAGQKRRYLPDIASGALRLQAFGVTEPTTGSDTTRIRTRAERRGDVYVVNGQKVWTSRALHSDLMLLLVRTTPVEACARRTDGLSTLIVDLREAKGRGIDIRPIPAMINHNTTEVFIENLEVPVDNLIGEEGKGFRYILDGMNAERILVAQECIGDGRWLLQKAVDYANEREVFGRKIGQNQAVQFPLARAYMQLEAADLMARKAAALFEGGRPCGAEANMAKLLASEATWQAADTALQTHGGFGYAKEYDIERKWREVRLYQTAPISTNLILSFLGEHVLGLPRSY